MIIVVQQEFQCLHVLNVLSSHGDVHSVFLHGTSVASGC